MSHSFNAQHGLIVVEAEITGPIGRSRLRLALDTGAMGTLISAALLVYLGYDPALTTQRVQVTTGSGVEFVPRFPVQKIAALGQSRTDFPVLCHTLPPSATVDGLLGLDFFRGHVLTLDFANGQVTLA
jgi:Aspartyl protease